MQGPLQDIKVLDLSRVLAGPWASQLLADYGAEVIKVEQPGRGDDTRQWGPPWLRADDGSDTAESAYFLATNRNKKSITVNIADAAGQQLIRELVAQSDVVLENFRVGSLVRYGLDAATLLSDYPTLIYCSISAYGQDSQRAAEPGYDAMIQASAGLMSLTGDAHGEPQKTGVAVADIMAGMYAVSGILAALHARERTGAGQHIDVPLFDSQVAWLANQAMNYLVGEEVPMRHGNAHPNIVPYQSFKTADGYLMLAVGNDRQFADCVEALGLAHLAQDARFSGNSSRVKYRDELVAELATKMRTASTADWLQKFRDRGVPSGPINDLAQVFSDPQTIERGLVHSLPHPSAGSVPSVANPVRFSATPTRMHCAPPLLGEHTDDVLTQALGYSPEKIAALRAAGTI
ncbi:CaiB/BaiF CoA transferase family protein [Woeseia oceani]|uniref:CoA-transferase n=1 Tax=Woeseia oceani TaxID=1548547 RepID=A0A193LFV3_9GAMM|nr:CaiB/BaiF CoA-transferase family protein [Woeseia oceani]ANO51415.1 CoA-transferase [Woeseia oceani]